MAWLKGTTTWGALPQKLAQLLTGEVADDASTTVASADRWVREFTRSITDGVLNGTTSFSSPGQAAFTQADKGANLIGTGIPAGTVINTVTNATTVVMSNPASASASGVSVQIAHDTLRTPASKDASTGNISNRCGYFAQVYNPGDVTGAVGRDAFCKVTAPFTSDPTSSGFHRWVVSLQVSTVNSVAGNYSTATISERWYDADTGSQLVAATRSPNAAGLVVSSNGLQYQVGDASGILLLNTLWQRGFNATYMYGIDLWKMLHRQGATAPSFSVAPPGVAGTDYDIVRLPTPCYLTASSGITQPTPFDAFIGTVYNTGNLFHGLGIKTATGLGANPLYTVSFSMALFKGRIFNSGTNGVLSLDVGQSMVDAVNSTGGGYRLVGNVGVRRVATWLKCATTPGSVTNASLVQYWISAKADGVVMVLNMDPGATGKLGSAMVCAFTPVDSTYDVLPLAFTNTVFDYSTDQTSNPFEGIFSDHLYLWLRRQQDGSEGSRDWQTKWMRADMDHSTCPTVGNATNSPAGLNAAGTVTSAGAPLRQNKPAPDGKWWLYGYQIGEGASQWGGTLADESRMIRGSWNTRWFFLPGDGWISGDELTDPVTGAKYFLAMPDYLGVGARWRTTTNTYQGGLAVAEL